MARVNSTDFPRNITDPGFNGLVAGKFHWGEYASTASLPNVAADGKAVAAGDLACVGGRTYECVTPTSGSAVWHPLVAITGTTRVFTQPVNLNAANLTGVGTDAAASASTDIDYVEFEIPRRMSLTGAACLNGTTVGTDKVIYSLHNSAGTFIVGTDPTGTLGAVSDVFQEIAFTAVTVVAPGRYFLGLKVNGTTHCHQRATAGSPMRLCEREGSHVFLTAGESITSLATTFTAGVAPIGYVY